MVMVRHRDDVLGYLKLDTFSSFKYNSYEKREKYI